MGLFSKTMEICIPKSTIIFTYMLTHISTHPSTKIRKEQQEYIQNKCEYK